MAKYINPFCDVGFKRIFGQEYSKPLLISFLNNLLKGEKVITDLTFLDKEQPGEYEEDRSLIYDIYCDTAEGEKIIVEMQRRTQPNFKKRSIYYVSQAISRQGEKGTTWKYNIKAVYLVALLGFRLEDVGDEFRTDVALMNMKTQKLFSTDVRMIYLQLPLFTKTVEECETDFDKWIYALKNMEDLITKLPWAGQDSVFAHLAKIADISSLTKEDRMRYDTSIRRYRDYINVMEGAVEEGLEKGRAEGRAEGLEKGRAEGMEKGLKKGRAEGRLEGISFIVHNMRSRGFSVADIANATGLSEEEVSGS